MTEPAGIQVFHVDDEPDLVELAANMLEREDSRISVETATSASDGLDRLTANDFDCIVSDYQMPGQNGIEFLNTIRDEYPDLPFILYTGRGSEEVASEAISAGVTDYLQKETGSEQYGILANRLVNAVESFRATQHIERQNDLFRKAQDIATVGAWEYDIEAETFYNSEEVLKIHGLSPEENMNAEKSLEYYHPDDQQIIRTAFQQAIEEGEAYDLELRLIDDDGNERWVRTRGEPQYKDGDPIRVRGVIQDITEQNERERNLKRFKNAVEHAGHAVYITDADGTIDYVNSAFEEITGYPAEVAVGKNPRIIKSGEQSDEYYEDLWDTLLSGELWEEEVTNRRKNGELYYANQTIAPVVDEDDDIEAFVAIQTDITDRKEERERLKFLETLENELIELSTDFLRIEGRDIDTLIDDALETLGRLVEADRSYVFNIDHEAETLSNTHEWCAAGVEPQIDMLQDLPQDTLPWWMQKLGNFENVTIPNVAELPPEAEAEQELLQEQNIESLIVTPMISQDELVGFIGFDWVEEEAWSEDFIDILGMTSELVTSARRRDARRRELERHEAYLEESQDSITVVDEEGKVQFQSESVEGTTGYRPSDITGESGFEFVHPDDRQKVTELFTSVIGNPGETASAELRVETKDGSWRWVGARGVNKLDDPVINGIVTSSRDITETKERERELELFEQLIDQSNDEVYVTDAETGTIQRVNQTACDHLGYSEEELVGMEVPEISNRPDDVDDWLSAMERVQKQGGGQIETVHTRADGTTYPVDISSSYVELEGEAYVVTIGRDFTARKERERELRQQNERLEEFASVVAHDLRNPLNVAKSRIELAEKECDSEHLDTAADNIERSFDLIDDMLTLAEQGQQVSDMEPIDIASFVEACWENVETATATVLADIDTTIHADSSRFRQLLENLFRNAVEHANEDVVVRVGSLPDGFYVEDDGSGIPEDERGDVFEPGYSKKEDGTGFGLAIVRQIAYAHNWEVQVTEGADGGACFEFTNVEKFAE